ncbi:LytR C-terminal domain-containing protein [Acidithrix sp. C25]|uniref:LytR C-terminal domain-containing protein n=1 Tax=Acidithrix sp. C25 TaxID=1671482 RepID=UPI00191B963E|nr:LytR C-terminal domain-containing protein [Acidithrix sp. C25]
MVDGRFPNDEIFKNPLDPGKRPKHLSPNPSRSRLGKVGVSSGSAVTGVAILAFIALLAFGIPNINASSSRTTTTSTVLSAAPPLQPSPTIVSASPSSSSSKSSVQSGTSSVSSVAGGAKDSAPTTLPQHATTSSPRVASSPTTTGILGSTRGASSRSTSPTTSPTTSLAAGVNPANALITVRVANATSVAGAAGTITSKLAALGFNVLAPTNAGASNLSTTTVYYYSGFVVAGQAVARILGLPVSDAVPYSTQAPIGAASPSDINVVLGSDIAG